MSQINASDSRSNIRNPLNVFILAVAAQFGEKAAEVERFLKFAVVGVFGAIVDFGTLIVIQATIIPPDDNTRVALATSIAFCAAILNNFIWNRFWTYPDSRTRSMRRQLFLFTFISLVGWLGRTIWISIAYLPIGQFFMPLLLPEIQMFRPNYFPTAAGEAKLGTLIAMLFGIVVVMFWNFFANRYWTYNDVK